MRTPLLSSIALSLVVLTPVASAAMFIRPPLLLPGRSASSASASSASTMSSASASSVTSSTSGTVSSQRPRPSIKPTTAGDFCRTVHMLVEQAGTVSAGDNQARFDQVVDMLVKANAICKAMHEEAQASSTASSPSSTTGSDESCRRIGISHYVGHTTMCKFQCGDVVKIRNCNSDNPR